MCGSCRPGMGPGRAGADARKVRMLAEFALQVALTAWVYQDARRRDWRGDRFADTPFKWALGALFLWPLAVPVYLHRRGKRPLKPIDAEAP